MAFEEFRVPRWARWTGVAVVVGVILYGSLIEPPTEGVPSVGPLGLVGADKWLHALAYFGLAGSLAYALAVGRDPAAAAVLSVALAVVYGVGIEVAQAPLPERSFSVADMAADAVGAVTAVVVWRVGVGLMDRSRPTNDPKTEA